MESGDVKLKIARFAGVLKFAYAIYEQPVLRMSGGIVMVVLFFCPFSENLERFGILLAGSEIHAEKEKSNKGKRQKVFVRQMKFHGR